MRRLIVGSAVTAILTTLLLWIPVSAQSGPAPEPIRANAEELALGTVASVVAVMAWKLGMYGVDPRGRSQLTSGGGGTSRYLAGQTVTLPNIFGHRDVGSTTCPGQYGYARLDEIRTRVAALTPPALTDISNVAVAAARAASGQTTVVVRGADSALFTRTRALSGEWGAFRALPAGISTLGVAAFSDGNHLHLAVRGVDGGYWVTHAPYDANGLPWRGNRGSLSVGYSHRRLPSPQRDPT